LGIRHHPPRRWWGKLIGVSILGSTGSIGTQTLGVIQRIPGFRVAALASRTRWETVLAQAKEFGVSVVALLDEEAGRKAQKAKSSMGLSRLKVLSGPEGLEEVSSLEEVQIVVHAIPGIGGLRPLVSALRSGKRVAFAGKEALVSGGDLLVPFMKRPGSLVPVDSEHSAIFQCIHGENPDDVAEIILTASGGAFRDLSLEEMENVMPEAALKHPTWKMGPKITVDSATLFNKALEVMEAHYLFGVGYDRIKVVIHRESIVHSMVTFKDGSTKAQMAIPDMRLAIAYALTYPKRQENVVAKLDPFPGTLTFTEPDLARFPCLSLGYEAGKKGGTAPCVLSYADEVAVKAFLDGTLPFTGIYRTLRKVLDEYIPHKPNDVEDLERETEIMDVQVRRMIDGLSRGNL